MVVVLLLLRSLRLFCDFMLLLLWFVFFGCPLLLSLLLLWAAGAGAAVAVAVVVVAVVHVFALCWIMRCVGRVGSCDVSVGQRGTFS